MKDQRLIALIDPKMMKTLKATSKKAKCSVAEVVRQALAEYLAKAKS
ncbi:MAG: ribbon-helix-helix protein, CopG family [Candidatus Micrarchaeaceae archaeon]